jgi:hypothetical protein
LEERLEAARCVTQLHLVGQRQSDGAEAA